MSLRWSQTLFNVLRHNKLTKCVCASRMACIHTTQNRDVPNRDVKWCSLSFTKFGSVRYFSSSEDDQRDKRPSKLEIKGTILHVPNPFTSLKNKILSFLIQNSIDPSFTIKDFTEGAKQAVCYFTQLLVAEDYDTMKDFASAQAIEGVKELLSSLTAEQRNMIDLYEDDIYFAKPSIVGFTNEDGVYGLELEVFLVGVKRHERHPILIEMSLRFSQHYHENEESGWTIKHVDHFRVRDVPVISKDGD